MSIKIAGLCVHGALGNLFSLGMDALASKLNHATPVGVHFDVVGGNYPIDGGIIQTLIDAAKAGAVPMVFGHSLGGDSVWNFADAAKAAGVKCPLLASIDPVQWTDNDWAPPVGNWLVPDNVAIAMNFRQPYFPGGGTITARRSGTTLIQEHTYSYPHANFGQGLAMDTAPDIHAAILAAVLHYIQITGKAAA